MKEPLNIVEFVDELKQRPRGRACLVLTEDYAGQDSWSAKLAVQTDSDHVHVLSAFSTAPGLSRQVSSFLMPDFFKWLQSRASKPVLIVSGFEFLLATWAGQVGFLEQFATQVEMWNRTPALLLVTQFDRYLADLKSIRFPDKTFVINQKETLALL